MSSNSHQGQCHMRSPSLLNQKRLASAQRQVRLLSGMVQMKATSQSTVSEAYRIDTATVIRGCKRTALLSRQTRATEREICA